MKQIINKLSAIIIISMILTGCGTKVADNGVDNSYSSQTKFKAEVIEAGDQLLITPDKDSSEYKSSDKMSVGISQTTIKDENGNEISLQDLKAGDFVEISYGGTILESYPAQITADKIKVTGRNILIDGYLALIDDIYQEDSGLNGDITTIALDTAAWTGLTEIEKEIIFSSMKEAYGMDIMEGTFDELSEKGLINQDQLLFPTGILITLSEVKYDGDKKEITCGIKKWRSGDGAVGSDNVTAKYLDGKWDITKSGMWIS